MWLTRRAMQALGSLSESELPPAVGLVLKLANEAAGDARTSAVKAVRQRLRSKAEVSPGALDAVRLAASQHPDVAAAMLGDIDADCRAPKSAAASDVRTLPNKKTAFCQAQARLQFSSPTKALCLIVGCYTQTTCHVSNLAQNHSARLGEQASSRLSHVLIILPSLRACVGAWAKTCVAGCRWRQGRLLATPVCTL